MRKLITAVCLAFLVTPLSAQEAVFGLRSGQTFGGISGPGISSPRSGLTLAPTLTIPLTHWLGLQTELAYSSYRGAFSEPVPAWASFHALSVPVMARVDIAMDVAGPVQLTLLGGVHADYTLRCRLSAGDGSCGASNPYSPVPQMGRFDVGPAAGVELSAVLFDAIRVGSEIRYQRGLQRGGFLGSMRREAWSIGFRLAGIGGASGGASLDAPEHRSLPNQLAPHIPRWRESR